MCVLYSTCSTWYQTGPVRDSVEEKNNAQQCVTLPLRVQVIVFVAFQPRSTTLDENMSSDQDACVPTVVTDFIFDLYDSVTLSQLTEEQTKLYAVILRELSQKYFDNTPWPSVQSIARECNGDPLFLAVYRELTHRHWHAVSRPSLRDRMEGWNVYRELFEEILDTNPNFYLLPVWVFEILHEFLYQFQGFCQIRTAVFSSARKYGLLSSDGTINTESKVSDKHANLAENLSILQNNTDAWDVESVFGYLNRLIQIGMSAKDEAGVKEAAEAEIQPVYSYFSLFGSIVLSRLECLMGDYTASLQALYPLHLYQDFVIAKDEGSTVADVLQSVFSARLSLAYHTGINFLMLARYKDAVTVLADCAGTMQRGFKTGALRKQAGSDQFMKQYERILGILAILLQICPGLPIVEDSVIRAVRDKHGSKIEAATSYEEWFLCPKFIASDPHNSVYRQQVDLFLKEMESQTLGKKLRSYLKLYTSLPVEKLAKFHDLSSDEFMPLLLSYKLRMRQKERSEGDSWVEGKWKTALDIHYYIEQDTVFVDEAEIRRQFENFFVAQIAQSLEIQQDVLAVDLDL